MKVETTYKRFFHAIVRVSDVKSFHALTNFYRRFEKYFSNNFTFEWLLNEMIKKMLFFIE